MKKLILFVAVTLATAYPLFAQEETKQTGNDEQEIKALFHRPTQPVHVGYYIGPDATYTQFDGRSVYMAGLSGGIIINHVFSLGLGLSGIVNPGHLWYDNVEGQDGGYLYGGYGGVKMEFKVLPKAPVHVSFPVIIGGGGLVYTTWSLDRYDYDYDYIIDWDSFFVVEPGVMVEVNLLKFMRLGAGISYRYTPDLDITLGKSGNDNGLINNFNANLSLKFGKF
jgi:hypothetical protein